VLRIGFLGERANYEKYTAFIKKLAKGELMFCIQYIIWRLTNYDWGFSHDKTPQLKRCRNLNLRWTRYL